MHAPSDERQVLVVRPVDRKDVHAPIVKRRRETSVPTEDLEDGESGRLLRRNAKKANETLKNT